MNNDTECALTINRSVYWTREVTGYLEYFNAKKQETEEASQAVWDID